MNILTYLLLMSLIQVVLYGYYLLFLRNETWFRFNRVFLLGTLILSFFLPLTKWSFFPELSMPSVHEVLSFTLEPVLITAKGQAVKSPIDWSLVAWNIYLTGVLASVGLFAYRMKGLLSFIKRLEVQERTPFYTLYHTRGQLPTSSFFRYIFWDETQELTERERRQILDHEYTHVQQGHSWDLLFLELIQIVLWFHPMIYLIRKELIQVHEFHADQKATVHSPKSSYAELILKEVLGQRIPLTHSFFESPAVLRIRMLSRMPNVRRALGKYLAGVPLIALLVLFYRAVPVPHSNSDLSFLEKFGPLNPKDSIYLQEALLSKRKSDSISAQFDKGAVIRKLDKYLQKRATEAQQRIDFMDQLLPYIPAEHQSTLESERDRHKAHLQLIHQNLKKSQNRHSMPALMLNEISPIIDKKEGTGESDKPLSSLEEKNREFIETQNRYFEQQKSELESKGRLVEESKKKSLETFNEIPREPDVNAFVPVEQEPKPLNMRDIRMAIGYPQEAREAGIEGTVVVRVLVDAGGKYVRHVVLNGAHPALEESVVEQISKLTFSPAMQDGKPVKFWVNIPFAFKLIQ